MLLEIWQEKLFRKKEKYDHKVSPVSKRDEILWRSTLCITSILIIANLRTQPEIISISLVFFSFLTNTFLFTFLLTSMLPFNYFPVDTGRKLNVHKTFRRRPGRLLNVLCMFSLRPVSTGFLLTLFQFYFSFYFTFIFILCCCKLSNCEMIRSLQYRRCNDFGLLNTREERLCPFHPSKTSSVSEKRCIFHPHIHWGILNNFRIMFLLFSICPLQVLLSQKQVLSKLFWYEQSEWESASLVY